MQQQQAILLYQTEDGRAKIQVRLTDNTVWLTQAAMVQLFQSSKSNISEHIKHVFEESENRKCIDWLTLLFAVARFLLKMKPSGLAPHSKTKYV